MEKWFEAWWWQAKAVYAIFGGGRFKGPLACLYNLLIGGAAFFGGTTIFFMMAVMESDPQEISREAQRGIEAFDGFWP